MDIKAFLDEKNTLQAHLDALDAMLHRKYWVDRNCYFKADVAFDVVGSGPQVVVNGYDAAGTRLPLDSLADDPAHMDAFLALSTGFRAWTRGQVPAVPTHADLGLSKDRPDPVLSQAERNGDVEVTNLCSHEVYIYLADGACVSFPACAPSVAARVDLQEETMPEIAGCPCVRAKFGNLVGLPDPVPGVLYIVSSLVMQACPDRSDLISPDTRPGYCVRGADGRVTQVKQFRRQWL